MRMTFSSFKWHWQSDSEREKQLGGASTSRAWHGGTSLEWLCQFALDVAFAQNGSRFSGSMYVLDVLSLERYRSP